MKIAQEIRVLFQKIQEAAPQQNSTYTTKYPLSRKAIKVRQANMLCTA